MCGENMQKNVGKGRKKNEQTFDLLLLGNGLWTGEVVSVWRLVGPLSGVSGWHLASYEKQNQLKAPLPLFYSSMCLHPTRRLLNLEQWDLLEMEI